MFWFGQGLGGWGWGWVIMSISMLLFWALIIAAIVFVARGFQRRTGEGPASPPLAQQVLAERFARGEINEDEYRQRMAVLTGGSTTQGHR